MGLRSGLLQRNREDAAAACQKKESSKQGRLRKFAHRSEASWLQRDVPISGGLLERDGWHREAKGFCACALRSTLLSLGRGERKQRAVLHSCMLHLVGEEGFVLTPGHFQLGLGLCFFAGAETPSSL